MIKSTAVELLQKKTDQYRYPFTPERLLWLLCAKFDIGDYTSREAGKMREYIRDFIDENLLHRMAGGVIYPSNVGSYEDLDFDELHIPESIGGLSDAWISMIDSTYKHGVGTQDRKVLTSVYLTGLDMRLGRYHYLDVGYTSQYFTKAWFNYFYDPDIRSFRDSLDHRVGYSNIFRCATEHRGTDSPCLDSVSVTYLGNGKPVIHANYSVSNLNRMTLMDFYMLHRFIRLIIPFEMLKYVEITCHFNIVTLDLTMLGWLTNIKKFRKIITKHSIKKSTNFKRIELPKSFAKRKKAASDVGLNTFVNNMFGLESLNEKRVVGAIIYHESRKFQGIESRR